MYERDFIIANVNKSYCLRSRQCRPFIETQKSPHVGKSSKRRKYRLVSCESNFQFVSFAQPLRNFLEKGVRRSK